VGRGTVDGRDGIVRREHGATGKPVALFAGGVLEHGTEIVAYEYHYLLTKFGRGES
jgi:hypothetical protein